MFSSSKLSRAFSINLLAGLVVLAGCAIWAGCTQQGSSVQQSPEQTEGAVSADTSELPEEGVDFSESGDVPYVPTPPEVVDRMLELAEISEDDVLYDLGSGDGRIVIAAARDYGTRGVGIEINTGRVEEARQNAQEAGVADLVEFRQQDLFETDLREATAVTLYLLPSVNMKLRPKLLQELPAGTPVVSHDFDMGDWDPEQTVEMGDDRVYRWTVPEEIPDHLK